MAGNLTARNDIQTTFRGYAPDERGAHKPPELVFEVDAREGLATKPMGFLERLWRLDWRKKTTLVFLLVTLWAIFRAFEKAAILLMAALSS